MMPRRQGPGALLDPPPRQDDLPAVPVVPLPRPRPLARFVARDPYRPLSPGDAVVDYYAPSFVRGAPCER